MDPAVNRFDRGDDPLKYYAQRVKLSQEIWGNMEEKLAKPGEGYQVLRRSFLLALFQAGRSLYSSSKYLGGVSHRSEERRVGKECRSRWWPCQYKKMRCK